MVIPSISYNQEEIIQWIIDMHTGPIELDPTYGDGVFYRNIQKPKYMFDINPEKGVEVASADRLPVADNSINSIMFDPPFLHDTGKHSIIGKRFGYFPTLKVLWGFYEDCIIEFSRKLKDGGHLIFKCQDTVSDHKNWFSHVEIMNLAVKEGFYPKDLFILLSKHRLPQWNRKNQFHARKFHSYFWVFEKRKSRIDYSYL